MSKAKLQITAPVIIPLVSCILCDRTQHDGALLVGNDRGNVCDHCIERGTLMIAQTLGQSPAGRTNAINQLFRPKAHKKIRRLLTTGNP